MHNVMDGLSPQVFCQCLEALGKKQDHPQHHFISSPSTPSSCHPLPLSLFLHYPFLLPLSNLLYVHSPSPSNILMGPHSLSPEKLDDSTALRVCLFVSFFIIFSPLLVVLMIISLFLDTIYDATIIVMYSNGKNTVRGVLEISAYERH